MAYEPYEAELALSEIRVNEGHWGKGAEDIVRHWLLENYDRETMPRLVAATIKDQEGIWLLGWKHEGTDYPPLLEVIFGEGYATHRLDQIQAGIDDQEGRYGIGQRWSSAPSE